MISGIFWKLLFAVFSLTIAISDIKTNRVPRAAFIIAFPVLLVLKLFSDEQLPYWEPIAGCMAGFFIFILVFFVSGRKLGLADVWYSTIIGLVLGPWWWYAAMGGACITGIMYVFITKQRRIPFIPFMALGSIVMSIIRG